MRIWICAALALVACASACPDPELSNGSPPPVDAAHSGRLWLSAAELQALPTSGPAWKALRETAREPTNAPNLSDQDDPTNVRVLAKALVAARTNHAGLAREVAAACEALRGTEQGADALAISRELMTYVVAADLIGLSGVERDRFAAYLRSMQQRSFQGRTIRSTHEERPNNWGTHAGATRIAVAAFLGDQAEVARAAHVFQGWTGDPSGWERFKFKETWWQAPGTKLWAVNPAWAFKNGHPIGGGLPDDQRRGGPFRWPPPRENYVWEALQGAVAQAVLLERLGYPAFEWGDRALLRAFEWLHEIAHYPAEGDDTWQPHVINAVYGTDFPAPVPSRPGKALGFTDWLYGSS